MMIQGGQVDPVSNCKEKRFSRLQFLVAAGFVALTFWFFIVPSLVRKPGPRQWCIPNLKQIEGAVQQWALENKKLTTDIYSFSDKTLLAYLKGSVLPQCPQGGRYSPGTNITDGPKCSYPGHTL
jgi:hypothetical protein